MEQKNVLQPSTDILHLFTIYVNGVNVNKAENVNKIFTIRSKEFHFTAKRWGCFFGMLNVPFQSATKNEMGDGSMKDQKKPGRWKRRIRKFLGLLLVLVLLAGAGFFGYLKLKQEYTTVYDSYTASTGSISNALSFSGSLQLIDSASYMASSEATVRSVYVAEGDQVKENDRLVRLSDGETIKAEFDGRVNKVNVEPDEKVYGGDSLVQVADFSHMRVQVRIDEYDISDVSVGDACTVTATATEKTFQSQISSIDYISASGGNVAYYTAIVYVDITEEGVYPGMQVTVTVPQEQAENVVVLKVDALSFDETNSAYVWMKNGEGEDAELTKVPVEVGVSNGNYVEIKSGLADGDVVYVESKVEEASAIGGLFSSMFGSTQMNGPMGGGGGNMPDFGGGTMPDFGGTMPDFSGGGQGGNRDGQSGGNRGGGQGGGNR